MTTFTDGPAAGTVLSLRRAPIFIRAVQNRKGEWDALDQQDDEPKAGETVHIYILKDMATWMHLLIRGKGKAGGGFYAVAEYRYLETNDQVRDVAAWRAWVDDRREFVPPHLLRETE